MKVKGITKHEYERDPEFSRWITSVMGAEKLQHCIQCGMCSAACPLAPYMQHTPRQLIQLAREGFKEEVLKSSTFWFCSSCYACAVQCPKEIKVTEVMYALKRRAMEEKIHPKRASIPVMAKEFARMVYKRGRVTETELMTLLMLKTNPLRFFKMSRLGRKLMKTGRFSLKQEKIEARGQLKKMLDFAPSRKQEKKP